MAEPQNQARRGSARARGDSQKDHRVGRSSQNATYIAQPKQIQPVIISRVSYVLQLFRAEP